MIDATSIIGQRFGRLLVVGVSPRPYRQHVVMSCVCDCGRPHRVRLDVLRRGASRSCGCLSGPIDLAGQRFGRLVAIEVAGRDKAGRVTWLCACDCGKRAVVESRNLRRGTSRSCGCLRRETARARMLALYARAGAA